MSAGSHIDALRQPAAYCCNYHAGTSLRTCNLSMNPCASAAPSSGFTNVDSAHPGIGSFVTSPSHNASSNQALAGTPNAPATGNQHIPIWSLSTVNNGWNPGNSFAPQSLSHVTPGPFTTACSWPEYPSMYSDANTIENCQPDPTLQFPDANVCNDFNGFGNNFVNSTPYPQWGNLPAIGNGQPDRTLQFPGADVYNDFNGFGNNFVNSTPCPQWGNLPAIDSHEIMTSDNQLPLPITTGVPVAPTLPTHATGMLTAPAAPRPIASGVTSRRSKVNTKTYICGYAGCGKICARQADLNRHIGRHGVRQHPCNIPGCDRRGAGAFYRTDKLRDHQRKKHGIRI